MRKIATCLATLALILSAGTASAETDFDALLGELNFGATPNPGSYTLTLDDTAAEALAPAPEPIEAPIGQPLTMPEMAGPATSYPQTTSVQRGCDTLVSTPCAVGGCDSGCSSGACGTGVCGAGACGAGACGSGACGSGACGSRCNGRYGGLDGCFGYNCVPHTPPNLPKSTLHQYWKSNACNSRVWDGFQNRCIASSKHSRGECDCFDPSKKRFGGCGTSGPVVYPASAIQCGDGNCLQLPAAWRKRGDCAGQADCAAPAGCATGAAGCDARGTACDSPACDS